jgi:AraC-like DNA-binding protein
LEIEKWNSSPFQFPDLALPTPEPVNCDYAHCLEETTRDDDTEERTRLFSWTDDQLGIFGTTVGGAEGVAIESVATKDILAFAVHPRCVNVRYASTSDVVGNSKDPSLTTFFLPKDSTLRLSSAKDGFHSLTLLVGVDFLTSTLRNGYNSLPSSLKEIIEQRTPAIQTHSLQNSVKRIAEDLLVDPTEEPMLPQLYYRGKASNMLCEIIGSIIREDRHNKGLCMLGDRDSENLSRVRALIEGDPSVDHSIEQLGRVAAMNRTKLRYLFKQVYGTTISQFRTSERMQQAEMLLHQTAMTVSQIGYEVGYADTSSFIVAFKNHFGVSPGCVRRSFCPHPVSRMH